MADVPAVLAVQEPGAIAALAAVFPQEHYPFPRDEIAERWLVEIDDPSIECFAIIRDAAVAGFAATRGDELLHFGTAVEHWGTGLATRAHDALLSHLAERGIDRAWLRVFTGNGRARRFYERLGWQPTGEATRSTYPPCPELLHYERPLTRPSA